MFRGVVIRVLLFFAIGFPVVIYGTVVDDLQRSFVGTDLENALNIDTLDLNDPDPKATPIKRYRYVVDQLADTNSVKFPVYVVTARAWNGRLATDIFDMVLLRREISSDFLLLFVKEGDSVLDRSLQACADAFSAPLGGLFCACGTVAELTVELRTNAPLCERVQRYNMQKNLKSVSAMPVIDTTERGLLPRAVAAQSPVGGSPATRCVPVFASVPECVSKKRDRVAAAVDCSRERIAVLPFSEHYIDVKKFFNKNKIFFTCRYLDRSGNVKHLDGQHYESEGKTVNVIFISFDQLTKENLKKFKISRQKDLPELKDYCHVMCYGYKGEREDFVPSVLPLHEYFYASIKPIGNEKLSKRYADSFADNWRKLQDFTGVTAGGDERPHKRSMVSVV